MQTPNITKSELICELSTRCDDRFEEPLVEAAVRELLELMTDTLVDDGRIEVRGFGTFCLHKREARLARNPRTGEKVAVTQKAIPFFKVGKALREAVDE